MSTADVIRNVGDKSVNRVIKVFLNHWFLGLRRRNHSHFTKWKRLFKLSGVQLFRNEVRGNKKLLEVNRQLILRLNFWGKSYNYKNLKNIKILFKQWRFLIIGNRLRLARESTYKFAGLHHKGGSEKLRNVVSFVRLRKGRVVKTTLRRIGRLWSFYLTATTLYKQKLRKTAFKSLRSGQKTHPVLFYTNDGFACGYLNSCSAELFVCGSFISSQSASAQTFPRNSLHSTGFLFYIPNFGVWRQPLSASGIFATSWYVEFLIS